jgi:hypothetical protein
MVRQPTCLSAPMNRCADLQLRGLLLKSTHCLCRDKPNKPFRCLDPQYRRELVRVYLTNVEGICRRFCEDKKARLAWARDEAPAFRHFWSGLTPEQQRKLLSDKGEAILKARAAAPRRGRSGPAARCSTCAAPLSRPRPARCRSA